MRILETHPTRCIKIFKILSFQYWPFCRRHLADVLCLPEPIDIAVLFPEPDKDRGVQNFSS